jgi:hypothetical protein
MTLVGFCCCVDDIRFLGVLVGFGSFSSSILQKALGEDVHHVDVLLKLWDIQVMYRFFLFKGFFICCLVFPPSLNFWC